MSDQQIQKQMSETPRQVIQPTTEDTVSTGVPLPVIKPEDTLGVQVASPQETLIESVDSPSRRSDTEFLINTSHQGAVVIKPLLNDPFNPYNYGKYIVRFDSPIGGRQIATIEVVPDNFITLPDKLFVRDSFNKELVNCLVVIVCVSTTSALKMPEGFVLLSGSTDSSGTIHVNTPPAPGTFEITLTPAENVKDTLAPQPVQRVFYNNLNTNAEGNIPPVARKIGAGLGEIILRWGSTPEDLDSYIACSLEPTEPKYFSNRDETFTHGEQWMKLDSDVRTGSGPETCSFNFVPGVQYVYAVHNYSGESSLPDSQAVVNFNFSAADGTSITQERKVFKTTTSGLRWWIVCVIDGTTRRINWVDELLPGDACSGSTLGQFFSDKYPYAKF